jgi:hypothetical protein
MRRMHGFPLRTAQCSAEEKSVNHVAGGSRLDPAAAAATRI